MDSTVQLKRFVGAPPQVEDFVRRVACVHVAEKRAVGRRVIQLAQRKARKHGALGVSIHLSPEARSRVHAAIGADRVDAVKYTCSGRGQTK